MLASGKTRFRHCKKKGNKKNPHKPNLNLFAVSVTQPFPSTGRGQGTPGAEPAAQERPAEPFSPAARCGEVVSSGFASGWFPNSGHTRLTRPFRSHGQEGQRGGGVSTGCEGRGWASWAGDAGRAAWGTRSGWAGASARGWRGRREASCHYRGKDPASAPRGEGDCCARSTTAGSGCWRYPGRQVPLPYTQQG